MAAESPSELPPVPLDGTTLEGGGQLLRLSLSLSSLTRTPIHVTDIRGKRGPLSRQGQDGGIKSAHLAGAKWLAKASQAETEGMELKSRELIFRPAMGNARSQVEQVRDAGLAELSKRPSKKGKPGEGGNLWLDILEGHDLLRWESRIAMSTPGSVFHILQAILPYLLFSSTSVPLPSNQENNASGGVIPLRVIIQGGTNVMKAPSYEYVEQVLLPTLHEKVGLPRISMKLNKRGWTTGTTVVGSVTFDMTPCRPGFTLPAFNFTDRGAVKKFHVSVLAPHPSARKTIREQAMGQLLQRYPNCEIVFPTDADSRHPKRLYLLIVAETSNGYRLGRDWLYDSKPKLGNTVPDEAIEKLVSTVIADLELQLAHGGCMDEFMQDQLVVFQALAEGKSVVDGGRDREASLHTQTCRWVVEKILGLSFDEEGSCEGVGLRAGETYRDRKAAKEDETLKGVQEMSIE